MSNFVLQVHDLKRPIDRIGLCLKSVILLFEFFSTFHKPEGIKY